MSVTPRISVISAAAGLLATLTTRNGHTLPLTYSDGTLPQTVTDATNLIAEVKLDMSQAPVVFSEAIPEIETHIDSETQKLIALAGGDVDNLRAIFAQISGSFATAATSLAPPEDATAADAGDLTITTTDTQSVDTGDVGSLTAALGAADGTLPVGSEDNIPKADEGTTSTDGADTGGDTETAEDPNAEDKTDADTTQTSSDSTGATDDLAGDEQGGAERYAVIQNADSTTTTATVADIKAGMTFSLFEADATPVKDVNGNTLFVATSDAIQENGLWDVQADPAPNQPSA